MATIVPIPPSLSGDLTLYHTTDPLLGNSPVLVFHGPAATVAATSSRIQIHVFTPAGTGSYARLSVSPVSPFYTAVSNLPREEQGDEVCRGLAFGLKKYFAELSDTIRRAWCAQVKAPSAAALFGDDHIAILATRMSRIENVDEVVLDLSASFCEQRLSWIDVDVVLPPGAVKDTPNEVDLAGMDDIDEGQLLKQKFGRYANVVQAFGDPAFLPTSSMKRAPSKVTAVGRTTSFLSQQKDVVRREMTELVSTEESYVTRLSELHQLSSTLGADLKPRQKQQLREIFPPAISEILQLHSKFFSSIRSILDDTKASATQDIQTSVHIHTSTQQTRQDLLHDTQGVTALANCLCEWFLQFGDGYREYLSTQAQSSQLLRMLLRSDDTLAAQLQEAGEQKLTSLLIEPVQRLPRYTLYIDGITKQLPIRHSALKPLLKARDLITAICAEMNGSETATILERLSSRVQDWPADIQITGRLVTASDFEELAPPYSLDQKGCGRGILILFTDGVVIVEKSDVTTVSARTLLTEVESGSLPIPPADSPTATSAELKFVRRVRLDTVQCTESHDGQVLQLLTFFELSPGALAAQQPTLDSFQVLRLEYAYDGKAARFVEEVCKARVEFRFDERERDSRYWEFRASTQQPDSLSMLCAIFDSSRPEFVSARMGTGAVRVVVDIDRHADRPRAGHNHLRTVVALSPGRDGLWRVTVDSIDGSFGREHVETTELVPHVSRKLASLCGIRLNIEQDATSATLLQKNLHILQSIPVKAAITEGEGGIRPATPRERPQRARSPKKLLSTFLSSVGPGGEPPAFLKKEVPAQPLPGQPPRMAPPQQKPPSRESRPSSKDQSTPRSMSSVHSTEQLCYPHRALEDTLSAYVLALQARKGNIVGRNVKMRTTADEVEVNMLYGSLLEDPNMMVLAAQAPVDVLFAAFEKFLNNAWKDQVGQVIPLSVLEDVQSKAETLFPIDFNKYFQSAIARLAPQNQRAFKTLMRLLADLLDGTGNDGDRGILTAAFAEVLVTDANPHDYIALLDRFMDDTDTYFGEPLEDSQKSVDGPSSSHKRVQSVNSASLTSNTSSLRRKFGFGTLSRENSKSETESKVASVWRTLSKSGRAEPSPVNVTPVLGRSYSTDTDARPTLSRPSSQDGGKSNSFAESLLGRTPSSNNLGLSTIGEHPSFIPTGPPRKKRRSSLSDLKALSAAQLLEPYSPPSARRPHVTQRLLDEKSLPDSPIPSTPSSKGGSGRFGTPSFGTPRSRLPSSFRMDGSPGASKSLSTTERPRSSGAPAEAIVITARPLSYIPSLAPKPLSPQRNSSVTPARNGLSERPGAGNIVKEPSASPDKTTKERAVTPANASTGSPKKLRMQSPQKLRERLQNEKSAIAAISSSLQDELSKIGDELTATPSRVASIRMSKSTGPSGRAPASQPGHMDLAQRVLKLEGQLPMQVDELNTRIGGLQSDLATSLSVSETKCKKLDELYRDAHRENEALYARFNDELGRILKVVRGGEGVEELKKMLKESQEETAKLRRETSRLKRENVGLRAQLKE